ncbi:hypothetical protein SynRS9907_00073 [Synechococcus sp. RS9907]|uniref:hypothetical protein n=1 Tax=Synechococcus sp. RS9907 TaxID=221350 RepID=UPI00165DD45A|nr:hypothetical protein [Synechococcus sp. RS9907]QNI80956.1 hypothetical protein SynRS9907_00073 [Synechococcus sp. RS9907]
MDADFEQHYQAAERAYGLGEYAEAHALTSALWDQLQSPSNEHDPGLILGWRAVVSLLLGHIQLHGLQQPEQATISYERVLQGDVDATIAALAEQGLERCRAEDTASGAGSTPATNGAIPDLLRDPFLSTEADQARPATAGLVTAMPWLSSDEEHRAVPTPDPSPTPVPSPEPMVTPEASSDIEAEMEVANEEPARSEEEPPVAVDPTPQEPAATKLLEHSWLRVQLQPDIKSPTDSGEPMGLINRIKGVFVRSAGR